MKVKVDYKDFLWFLNCSNFMKAATGMIIRFDQEDFDGLKTCGVIHNKYIYTCKIPCELISGKNEEIKILNGSNREGIDNIINEIKVLSPNDDGSIEILVRDRTIDFITFEAYSMSRSLIQMSIHEDNEFKKSNWEKPTNFQYKNIDVSVFKKTLQAYNKFHKLLPGSKVLFQIKNSTPSFAVLDAMASKKFAFPLYRKKIDNLEDKQIDLNFSILPWKIYMSNVDLVDLKVNNNVFSIQGKKQDSELFFNIEVNQ